MNHQDILSPDVPQAGPQGQAKVGPDIEKYQGKSNGESSQLDEQEFPKNSFIAQLPHPEPFHQIACNER